MNSFEDDGRPPHYYGDSVRKLFLASGVIMLVSLPFFNTILPTPLYFSIVAIVAVTIFAGLTNPRSLFTSVLNALVSLFALAAFEYYAVRFVSLNSGNPVFWINQILAVIFFFALYYSLKTIRGVFLIKKESKF